MEITKHPTIEEVARILPVAGAYDVLVAGGGIAGVAAAVAAARNGASVCLLERLFALGGLATLGNVTVWLPLCDGRGRQVCGGLAEEMLKLSVADLARENKRARFIGIPDAWQPGGDPEARARKRFQVQFNPSAYLLALEHWAIENGVKILYDTRVCGVERKGNRITHVIVENKSGRSAVACHAVVDATGDADICYLAGEETESLDTNVLCSWYFHLDEAGLKLHAQTKPFSPYADRDGAEGPFYRGDDAEQVTAHMVDSRAWMLEKLDKYRTDHPERDVQVVNPPTIPSFRMTRRLVGEVSLGERHVNQWFDDAVGLTGDWRKRGPVYAFPLRSLAGVRNRNLLVAGRCMSADTTVWDVTRVIPGCAVTGEAAGTAAALLASGNRPTLDDLPVQTLQERLRRQGAIVTQ